MNILLRKKGSVLVFSLIVLSIVLSAALSVAVVNVSNRKSAGSTGQSVQSFQVADSGVELMLKKIYRDDTNVALSNLGTVCTDGVVSMSVSGGEVKVSFVDNTNTQVTDCNSTTWRETLAKIKVEGTSAGTTRVIETSVSALSNMAWGSNASGQLGDSTTGTDRLRPVSTRGLSNWKSISAANGANGAHVLAIKADGTLWAWGLNDYGQLGDGTTTNRASPVRIGTDNTWKSVSAGEFHSFGIKTDDSLWAWGRGSDHRLGTGNASRSDTPVRIAYDNSGGGDCVNNCPAGWKMVSAGSNFSLAIGTDDSLWSWGNTDTNRLGHSEDGHKPAQVTGGGSWKMVSAGDQHSLGIKSTNELFAWGSREYGKLGDGSSSGSASSPTPIQAGTTWQSISAGYNHSLGVRMDGTLWAWGRNIHGQLGFAEDSDPHPSPLQIGASEDWKFVSAGNAHCLALKTNGANQELWSWGQNFNGQVGDNSRTSPHPTLFQVPGNWKIVEAGSTFSTAVRY